MDENETTVEDINDGIRKRQKKGRSASNNRNARYKDDDPLAFNFESVCAHNKGKFKCQTLTMNEIVYNRKLLYEKTGKNAQDIYLVRLISPCPIKRARPRTTSLKPQKNKFSVTYFLVRDSKKLVKVCKSFFLAALGLGKHRVNLIASTIFEGKTPRDKRGGDRKSGKSIEKKESVKKYIAALPAKESHYNRNKSKRVYVSSELNIRKLWEFYNEQAADILKVSESMFRRVFENEFNIGFSSPASDICSTCELLKNKQKIETRPEEIQSLKVQLRVHKIRAKTFFTHTKETPTNSFTICFDLQQIQTLPKTPIQESFYLRQVGLYSFCVTDMATKNPHFFIWLENQAKKGLFEVASALLTYLMSADLSGVELLRLFADGCGGQNKNSHVVHTLVYWLKNCAPANVTKIVLTFPVRGHSFLPADRVFGRVEKELRKKPFILNPKTYYEVYEKHGKVHILDEDWYLYDVKKLENSYKKVENIRDAKRIIIEKKSTLVQPENQNVTPSATTRARGHGRGRGRGTRRGSVRTPRRSEQSAPLTHITCGVKVLKFYNTEENNENAVSLLKPFKNHPSLLLPTKAVNEIKQQKKKDVEQILKKQFGEDWAENPELEWFKTNIFNTEANVRVADDHSDDEDDIECDCCEPDIEEFV